MRRRVDVLALDQAVLEREDVDSVPLEPPAVAGRLRRPLAHDETVARIQAPAREPQVRRVLEDARDVLAHRLAFGVAIWETMLQELVPEHLLARVISLDVFGSFGLMPVGLAIWASVANVAPPGALIASGAGVSSVLVAIALTRRWLWEID